MSKSSQSIYPISGADSDDYNDEDDSAADMQASDASKVRNSLLEQKDQKNHQEQTNPAFKKAFQLVKDTVKPYLGLDEHQQEPNRASVPDHSQNKQCGQQEQSEHNHINASQQPEIGDKNSGIAEGLKELQPEAMHERLASQMIINQAVVKVIDKALNQVSQLFDSIVSIEIEKDGPKSPHRSDDENLSEFIMANSLVSRKNMQLPEVQQQKQQKIIKGAELLEKIISTNSKMYKQVFTNLCGSDFIDQDQDSNHNFNPAISSSYSQRIRSSSEKKNSDGSEIEFNLGQTGKTNNSNRNGTKNRFRLTKPDSLVYSDQSGFGYQIKSSIKKKKDQWHPSHTNDDIQRPTSSRKDQQLNRESKEQKDMMDLNPSHSQSECHSDRKSNEAKPVEASHIQVQAKLGNNDHESEEGKSLVLGRKGREFAEVPKKRMLTEDNKPLRDRQGEKKRRLYFGKDSSSNKSPNAGLRERSNYHKNIFSTQISEYQHKISKLKSKEQLKIKKKKLEEELTRINYELKNINIKECEGVNPAKDKYKSRVSIANDKEAKKKAEAFAKNLMNQKRRHENARRQELKKVDKNIIQSIEELTKIHAQDMQKNRERKKTEVSQRMKRNEERKTEEQKKIQQSRQFVQSLKKNELPPLHLPPNAKNRHKGPVINKHRESYVNTPNQSNSSLNPHEREKYNFTPELSNKKVYLNQLRHFKSKKSINNDIYEQNLD